MTWSEYEQQRLAQLNVARNAVDAAKRKVRELELSGAEFAALSDARNHLYCCELALEQAELAE